MTYEEAHNYALTVEWEAVPCSQGEFCWCKMIQPKEPIKDEDGEDIWIVSSGSVRKEDAEHIVKLHNAYLGA